MNDLVAEGGRAKALSWGKEPFRLIVRQEGVDFGQSDRHNLFLSSTMIIVVTRLVKEVSMFRQDYILRLIQQFGVVWAQLVKQLQAGLFPSTRLSLNLAYKQLLGIDPEQVRIWDSHTMLSRMQFGVEPEYGRDRSLVLSALLTIESDLMQEDGDEEGAALMRQYALDLLLAVHLQFPEAELPDYTPSVESLLQDLADFKLSRDTYHLLMRYFEAKGDFAKAENALYDWLEDADATLGLSEGRAFYLRLNARSDEELEAGDFSREEVKSGLHGLEARFQAT